MNITINQFEDVNNIEQERIIFKVLLPDMLGNYAVFSTVKTSVIVSFKL